MPPAAPIPGGFHDQARRMWRWCIGYQLLLGRVCPVAGWAPATPMGSKPGRCQSRPPGLRRPNTSYPHEQMITTMVVMDVCSARWRVHGRPVAAVVSRGRIPLPTVGVGHGPPSVLKVEGARSCDHSATTRSPLSSGAHSTLDCRQRCAARWLPTSQRRSTQPPRTTPP